MENFEPITINVAPNVSKIQSCKVYYSTQKQCYFLLVFRVPRQGEKAKKHARSGYTCPEHAVHDAESFINFMERHNKPDAFEICTWPLDYADDRMRSEASTSEGGRSRKKSKRSHAVSHVPKKSAVERKVENKKRKQLRRLNKALLKLVRKQASIYKYAHSLRYLLCRPVVFKITRLLALGRRFCDNKRKIQRDVFYSCKRRGQRAKYEGIIP